MDNGDANVHGMLWPPGLHPVFVSGFMHTMFLCPYCRSETEVIGAAEFATIDIGRAICDHCGGEFLIIDNVPMKLEQYAKAKPQ
jgi:uncharacterized protein YbaR (Trm112 family)